MYVIVYIEIAASVSNLLNNVCGFNSKVSNNKKIEYLCESTLEEDVYMYKDYGRVYKVFIDFNKNVMNKTEVKDFVQKYWGEGSMVVDQSDYSVELLWTVPVNEGVHEIDMSLYYTLDDCNLGTYRCEYVE